MFGAKVNEKLKEVSNGADALQERIDNNTAGLEEVQERVDSMEETAKKVEKAVGKVEETVTDMAKQLESGVYQEMRAREAIKRNLVLYGVKEPDQRLMDSKDKMEADKVECEKIFIASGSKAGKSNIRFCPRLGERGEKKERPIWLGMK
jgi:predicted nuclease with TOPRIM domain